MPTLSQDHVFKVKLDSDDVRNLLGLLVYPVGSKLGLSDSRLAVHTAEGIEIEVSEEVTVEFDVGDLDVSDRYDWRD